MNFQINQIVFDSENKEYVKITNGITDNNNNLVPTEALAIRMVAFQAGTNKPIIGLTYRKVNSEKLSEPRIKIPKENIFDKIINSANKRNKFVFIGRI